MKSFLVWLLRPSRALQQAQAEITYLRERLALPNPEVEHLRAENRRLNDLFIQQLETARVLPVQPQHQTAPAPDGERQQTLAEMQEEHAAKCLKDLADWEREENERLTARTEAIQ